MDSVKLKVKTLRDGVEVPRKNNRNDAAFDLVWNPSDPNKTSTTIDSWGMLETGIAIQIPDGFYAQIQGRSGLASKFGLDVLGGVIDSGYRGELRVVLSSPYGVEAHINKGDRIAQLVIHRLPTVEVEEVSSLDDSERGEKGFGSSGR